MARSSASVTWSSDCVSGIAFVAAREADDVAYGWVFIANPDLPHRFALGAASQAQADRAKIRRVLGSTTMQVLDLK
jgi:2,4-dienoyl-CoA reductase-like NADH-dependent reductase (Old Yellow Enzyme family)